MELDNLYGFVIILLLVGIVAGIGVQVLGKFGDAAKNNNKVTNDTFTWTNGTNQTLAHGNLTSVSSVIASNSTEIPSRYYKIYTTDGKIYLGNDTGAGGTLNESGQPCKDGQTCYITYNYDEYNTNTRTATANTYTEIQNITKDWLPVVVIVVIAGLVLMLVFRSFNTGGLGRS